MSRSRGRKSFKKKSSSVIHPSNKATSPARLYNSKGIRAPPRPPRRSANNPLVREGSSIVSRLVRSSNDQSRKDYHNDVTDRYLNDSIGRSSETVEDIEVNVNPYILYQYVAGIVFRTMAGSDRWQDYNTCQKMVQYYCVSMKDIGAVDDVTVWPRAIVELAWALTPRRVGKYNYSAHWAPVDATAIDVGTNGFQLQNVGFDMQQYLSGVTDGYLNPAPAPITVPNPTTIRLWQDANFHALDLVNIVDGASKDIKSDASAFAYDTGGGRAYSSTGNGTLSLIHMIGYNAGIIQYLPINSTTGLETKIKRPHLAAIRLCTGCAQYGLTAYHTEPTSMQRLNMDSLTVCAAPSTLGFQRVTPNMKGKVQLKWVPGTGTVTNLLQRLETVATHAVSSDSGDNWITEYGLNDIYNLAVNLYKTFLKRYSGSAIGVRGVIPSGTFYSAEPYEKCFAVSSYNAIRVPEYIQKLIGAHTPFVDKDGILIPYVAALALPTPSLTYAGESTYTATPTPAQFGTGTLNQTVLAKYKPFESNFAPYENMRFLGQTGPTMMDVTFLRDINASIITGIASRRAQSPSFLSESFLLVAGISYDLAALSASGVVDTYAYNHSYRQHNRRFFSGYDTVALYQYMTRYDGIVIGALTSNMSDATGPDQAVNDRGNNYSLAAPRKPLELLKDVDGTKVGLITKYANRLLPRMGNYCGPGWTAGVDTANNPVVVSPDGKYLTPPTNDEDAVCKAHDEAYKDASGDRKKILEADWDMVRKLRHLRGTKGLSIYGLAAELAIASKANIASLTVPGAIDYFSPARK